jgi:hypothetical protein
MILIILIGIFYIIYCLTEYDYKWKNKYGSRFVILFKTGARRKMRPLNKNVSDHVKFLAHLTAFGILLRHKKKKIDVYNIPDIEKSLLNNPEWIASLKKEIK